MYLSFLPLPAFFTSQRMANNILYQRKLQETNHAYKLRDERRRLVEYAKALELLETLVPQKTSLYMVRYCSSDL